MCTLSSLIRSAAQRLFKSIMPTVRRPPYPIFTCRSIGLMPILTERGYRGQSILAKDGLWGGRCKSSMIDKENCALKCLSPPCFELVYQGDPLEEGEKDYIRSQEYKYCLHRLSLGESLDGIKGSFDY